MFGPSFPLPFKLHNVAIFVYKIERKEVREVVEMAVLSIRETDSTTE